MIVLGSQSIVPSSSSLILIQRESYSNQRVWIQFSADHSRIEEEQERKTKADHLLEMDTSNSKSDIQKNKDVKPVVKVRGSSPRVSWFGDNAPRAAL